MGNLAVSHVILSVEQLYGEADKLNHPERIETPGLVIFKGKHPQHGWVHLVIPAIGDGILLFPPATQAA